ncbi:MAG: glucan biosynthesis protein [Siculibacillus sp.]|nr:glucan biosynthesis protein [Siculibacillus sp.]
MDRRAFLSSSLSLAATLGLGVGASPVAAQSDAQPQRAATGVPFSFGWLKDEARRLASTARVVPKPPVPQRFADLTQDQYRDIRWKRDLWIWRDEKRGYRLEPLPSGFVYRAPVELHLVEDGVALPIPFDRDRFDWGANVAPPEDGVVLPFSGLKLRRPRDPDRWPEFAVFQGATYFKSIARDQVYGLTARGLAINTAEPDGEEFPYFSRFYIEKPEETAQTVRLYALLDSKMVTGAYRFTVRSGDETTIDVELTLFPREDLAHVGLGALNSMFLYGSIGRTRSDDIRPAVHLSDGLAVMTGLGERLWRPLANPRTLQISVFGDENPHGFGLAQRSRDFADYQDLERRWDLCPSAWVEPVGDWGKGSVVLVEIPSDSEIHENITAYWRPKTRIPAGQEYSAAYRLRWTGAGLAPSDIGRVAASLEGQGGEATWRRYAIDFTGPMPPVAGVKVVATASAGRIVSPILRPNPATGGYRVTFDLDPKNAPLSELRVQLTDGQKPVSETWLYRWVAA